MTAQLREKECFMGDFFKFQATNLQNEHFVRDILYFSLFEVQNIEFTNEPSLRAFLIKQSFCKAQTLWFLRSFRYFCTESQNAAPDTTFHIVTSLRSPATAIRQNSTFATRQSATPATRKRRDNVDTLLKYCACPSKCKRHLDAYRKTQHR